MNFLKMYTLLMVPFVFSMLWTTGSCDSDSDTETEEYRNLSEFENVSSPSMATSDPYQWDPEVDQDPIQSVTTRRPEEGQSSRHVAGDESGDEKFEKEFEQYKDEEEEDEMDSEETTTDEDDSELENEYQAYLAEEKIKEERRKAK